MQVNMGRQFLRPGVQHQAEGGRAVGSAHPLAAGSELSQRLRRAGKQGVDNPARMGDIQAIEAVGQGEYEMRIRHRQRLGQPAL